MRKGECLGFLGVFSSFSYLLDLVCVVVVTKSIFLSEVEEMVFFALVLSVTTFFLFFKENHILILGLGVI